MSIIASLLGAIGILLAEEFLVALPVDAAPLSVSGDVDQDGALTVNDLDLVSLAVADGTQSARYDLNGDDQTDRLDVEIMLSWTQRLPGDADLDGIVQLLDFLILADNFDQPGRKKWSEGDFNSDGTVQMQDFLILANNFGGSVADLYPVPTPSHFSVAIGIPLFWLARRRTEMASVANKR